jgi:predicted transport protein
LPTCLRSSERQQRLDECVREVILKLYIAFKAETNFVDIVPQAKRLRLSLNLDFQEIQDPRDICKDVSSVGRWGNGNVELFLEKIEDVPYVVGLVRQALERQLGDDDPESSLI